MTDISARDTAAGEIIPEISVPTAWTLGALAAGLALGLAFGGSPALAGIEPVLAKAGELWLRALQVTIVPLVVSLLVVGVVQGVAAASAGKLARRTVATFLVMLALASAMAALLMPLLLRMFPIPAEAASALRAAHQATGPVPGILDFVDSLVPSNILAAASQNAMISLILFTAAFALAITRLAPPLRKALYDFFAALTGAMMVMIGWVLKIAPVGVFALSFGVAARSGSDAIAALAHYILLVVAIGTVVFVSAYAIAMFGGGVRFGRFARTMLPSQSLALSTQSSLACLPAMLAACRELGVRTTSAELVLPLAVALYRATSPAMNLAVAIYVAKLSGIPITPQLLVTGFAVALATTVGSVSLPSSLSFVSSIGPICIANGIPIAPLGLMIAVEMLPDLMRTLGNVTMNVAITAAIDRGFHGTRENEAAQD